MKWFFGGLFIVSLFSLNAQVTDKFPKSYFGIYKGDLLIQNASGTQSVGMELHVNATDTIGKYQYKIVYITDDNRQERNYNLITKDGEKGQFVVDENNGILLEAKLFENKLISVFEVKGSLLITTETFYEGYMTFEIVFSNINNKSLSGGDSEMSPEVSSYPVSVYQYAKLQRQ